MSCWLFECGFCREPARRHVLLGTGRVYCRPCSGSSRLATARKKNKELRLQVVLHARRSRGGPVGKRPALGPGRPRSAARLEERLSKGEAIDAKTVKCGPECRCAPPTGLSCTPPLPGADRFKALRRAADHRAIASQHDCRSDAAPPAKRLRLVVAKGAHWVNPQGTPGRHQRRQGRDCNRKANRG